MKAYLCSQGWLFKLHSKTTRVGRHEDNDLCLRNAGVEESHALIEWREAERSYVLTDLDSAHGTYVNGCRIHNASVSLSHADQLHFGYGGPAYQLTLDTSTPLPLLGRHQSPAPPVCVWGGMPLTPHPPSRSPASRTCPSSAGAKQPGNSPTLNTHTHRPGSCAGNTGSRGSAKTPAASQSLQTLQRLLQEKEECVSRLEEEVSRLRVCEGECVRKDRLISSLRDDVSALTHTLTHSQAQAQLTHTLNSLQADVCLKTQQIQELTEQGEQVKQAVTDRDMKISTLRAQLDRLKTDNSRNSGLVTSLQSELLSKDTHTLKLTAEIERLKQDVRHKDAQLHNLSNKFSKKQQSDTLLHQNEVNTLKKSVESLEVSLTDTHRDVRLIRTDRDSLRDTLQHRTQELSSLKVELGRLKQQLVETQTNQQNTHQQLQEFYKQILQAINIDTHLSHTPTEQEVLEAVRELCVQQGAMRSRVQQLQEEHTAREEEIQQLTLSVEEERTRGEEDRKSWEEERTRGEEERRSLEEERRSLEEERTRGEEDRRSLEEDRRSLEEERRSLEEERKSVEEERTRGEEERRSVEEERRSLEEDRRSLEEERKSLEEERRRGEEERRSVEEERRRGEEERRSVEEERRSLEEEKRRGEEEKRRGEEEKRRGEEERRGREEEVETLRRKLEECQHQLQSFSMDTLQRCVSELEESVCVCVCPSLRVVQTLTHSLLHTLLTPLLQAHDLLMHAGIHVPNTSDGLVCAIKLLCKQKEQCHTDLGILQGQLQEQGSLKQEMETLKSELEACRTEESILREREEEQGGAQEERTKEEEKERGTKREEEKEDEEERGMKREEEEEEKRNAHFITLLQERLQETERERDGLREQMREMQSDMKDKAPPTLRSPTPTHAGSTPASLASHRYPLAHAQQEVVSRDDIIAALSRDLAQAHARMTDMTGELSEKQRAELERHRVLVGGAEGGTERAQTEVGDDVTAGGAEGCRAEGAQRQTQAEHGEQSEERDGEGARVSGVGFDPSQPTTHTGSVCQGCSE
ncbi:hypothetical protein ACEWY4_000075 [Coilia grayii]|uniref:FHA domain-containing protein n=1 Tax=Coilia grayii TaxID=363190 RepID=A0ABD1KVL2_9TELE